MELVPCDGGVALKNWRNPPKKVVLPAKSKGRRVCAILGECFRGCESLREFRVKDGSCLNNIGEMAFYKCTSLCRFVCPRSVESIGGGASVSANLSQNFDLRTGAA